MFSALPPKADSCRTSRHDRSVPGTSSLGRAAEPPTGAAQRHINVPSRISVGRLQVGLPCVDRYLKHLICFGAPEVARVEPHGIEPLRILPLPERIRVREDVAAM